METERLVLIADNTNDFGYMCSSVLEESGLKTRLVNKDGRDLISGIIKYEPSVVVADLFLPGVDALGVIQYMQNTESHVKKPKFIIMSGFGNSELQDEVMSAGASYYFLKPFDFDVLSDRIHKILDTDLINPSRAKLINITSSSDLELLVTDILHEIGVPAHIKGFHYIREAMMIAVEDNEILGLITKGLYPAIAQKFNTTPSRVERAIRHAIEVTWERAGEAQVQRKYILGYLLNYNEAKPTNSELIAIFSDKIRLEMKKQAIRI